MTVYKIIKEHIRRSIKNYKIYLVSILGMSIAITAAFHMYFFAFKELSTDSFHSKKKEVYRVLRVESNTNLRSSDHFLPLGSILKDKVPEVIEFTRIIPSQPHSFFLEGTSLLKEITFIDPSFFDLFDFKLVSGTVSQFKETPNGLIISEKAARMFFKPTENPIGKTIEYSKFKNPKKWKLQIVGIINIPETSTIQGDYFVNFSTYEKMGGENLKEYQWNDIITQLYIHVPIQPDLELLSSKMSDALITSANSSVWKNYTMKKENNLFELQRLDSLYFTSTDVKRQKKKGSYQFVKIIILIALLTLFLATTNYIIMNLGLNLYRAKEFKLRRHLGASKTSIYFQLTIESILNSLICFVLTIISYPIIGGFIAELIGFEYQLSVSDDLFLLVLFLGIILFLGILIGTLEYIMTYSIIFIKSNKLKLKKRWDAKKAIIIFQLFLFIGLFTCILFIGKQVNYIQDKDLGYDRNSVLTTRYLKGSSTALKSEIEALSYVKAISDGTTLFTEEIRHKDIVLKETNITIPSMVIQGNVHYLEVHQMELLYGKNLNPDKLPEFDTFFDIERMKNKGIIEVLVNEEFVKRANLKNPIGTILEGNISKSVIVGVFKNVLNTPLYYQVQPIVLGYDFNFKANLFQVSFEQGYKMELLQYIREFYINKGLEEVVNKLVKDKDYASVYKKEMQLKRLLEAFTLIVLFISILGMVAISLFVTESKTKEIGIRKANGASTKEIVRMLNKDFVKWVGIAFVIACPISYYLMSSWLENFAYKTALRWWIFAFSGVFTLVVALITVSWQTYKAATQNPVKSLRDE